MQQGYICVNILMVESEFFSLDGTVDFVIHLWMNVCVNGFVCDSVELIIMFSNCD